MPVKTKTIFVCKECGNEYPVWQGKCQSCGAWNSLAPVESFTGRNKSKIERGNVGKSSKPQKLSEITVDNSERYKTGINELDGVLSGGFVKGQVILLAGDPGIGKSTILMQIAGNFDKKVLYVSGEESEGQVAIRAKRLSVNNQVEILSTNAIEEVFANIDHDLVIIDSIQTLYSQTVETSAGSIAQIRECTFKLVEYAKSHDVVIVLVGHITKEGTVAGPKLLEHMVDTVLYLDGDKNHIFRILRVQKNRFGDDSEIGIFEMTASGLVAVSNPSAVLLDQKSSQYSGTAIAVIIEGNRPLALEVQALTTKTAFGYPKRTANGFSLNKLQLLCAVIQKRTNINLFDQDVYINVTAGINSKDPAIDLAVCAAIISSVLDKNIPLDSVFFGEIGLGGEVRKVLLKEKRIKEVKKLGFKNIYLSENIGHISLLPNLINQLPRP